MDNEMDQKPNDSQDKHQKAKSSFEDLQKLMEQFNITADEPEEPEETEEPETVEEPVLSVDELIERAAASGEEPPEEDEAPEEAEEPETVEEPEAAEAPTELEEEPAEQSEKLEKSAETADEEAAAEPEKIAEAEQPKPEKKKTAAAAPKKKPVKKKELKPAETQEDLEQQEREAILEGSSKRRRPDQPVATVNLNQKAGKKTSPAKKKKKKKNSKAAKARRRKKRLMRMCTAIVLLLVAIVLVVSVVKALSKHTKDPENAGSAVVAEDDGIAARQKEGPASQQESKQYLAIKDDDSLPSYAKEYPGMYADAVSEPNVLSDEKVCYLTFDDGPSSTNTPDILDTLKKAKVKATFFVVTSEIDEETAPILQRIVDEGHTLCIHANEHEYSKIYASTEAYLEDFAQAYDKIYELTGYRVQGFRFPGGSNGLVNSSGCYDNIVAEMTRRGFEYYDWNAYDHDSEGVNYSVDEIVNYAVHEVSISSRNDVILLMHDTYGKEKTVEALPSISSQLKEAGNDMLPITNATRPVHFEVDDTTPPEYNEDAAEEEDAGSSDSEEDTDSHSSDSDAA
ncbi:MAG: polysaccharide deacetylase [Clostridia bacterium]|nr:polysaccharide deacetylase [Clostridia bacterium]